LKKRTPRVTEAEFQEHKLAVAALTGWVFSHVPISTAAGEVLGTRGASASRTSSALSRSWSVYQSLPKADLITPIGEMSGTVSTCQLTLLEVDFVRVYQRK
jgi:hypothetical protein